MEESIPLVLVRHRWSPCVVPLVPSEMERGRVVGCLTVQKSAHCFHFKLPRCFFNPCYNIPT